VADDNIIQFPRQSRPVRIEIEGGIQDHPTKWTGAHGTWLDWSNVGRMVYWAALVDELGGGEILAIETSHQAVIDAARDANQWYGVEIVDLVAR
jgi:hypothetical protein